MPSASILSGACLIAVVALTTFVWAAPVAEQQDFDANVAASAVAGVSDAAPAKVNVVAPSMRAEIPATASARQPDVLVDAVARPAGNARERGIGQVITRADLQRALASTGAQSRCLLPDQQTLDAILPVATDHGSRASGVVFASNRVLTAAHAVEGGSRFFVRVGEDFRTADLLLIDHAQDLAVLGVDTGGIHPLPVQPMEPADAQPVWAVGFPRAEEMHASYGLFQRNRAGALHTSASIDSGQSGGGLLACRDGVWHLLGMLRGYGAFLSGDHYVKLQNHSVSVAATTIHHFLSVPRP